MTMTRIPFLLLPLLTILSACSHTPAPLDSGIAAPAAWQSPAGGTAASAQWWTTFNSAQLSQLIEQARQGSHDLRAAMARVRQAQADLRIAGAPCYRASTPAPTPITSACYEAKGTASRTRRTASGPTATSTRP